MPDSHRPAGRQVKDRSPLPGSQTSEAFPQPILTVQLLTLGRLNIVPGEISRVFFHRHLLSLYLVLMFVLIGLDTNGAARSLPIEQRGAIYVAAMSSFLAIFVACLLAGAKLVERGHKVRLHMSPILLLATVCSVTVGELVLRLAMTSLNDSAMRLILLGVFHYMFSELAIAIASHTLLPLVIGEVRGLPIRTLAETDPALWTTVTTKSAKVTPPPPVDGFLVVEGRSIPFGALLHLQADGNYVHIRSRDKQEIVPGPLSELVSQLPETLGRQVHRSHWVATMALSNWHADGREITLRLRNGTTVPVAITRRHEVRAWLESIGLPRQEPT